MAKATPKTTPKTAAYTVQSEGWVQGEHHKAGDVVHLTAGQAQYDVLAGKLVKGAAKAKSAPEDN